MAMLEVKSVDMVFGGLRALSDVSFSAEESRISALIGPNGAGKTTLFNIITGFYVPTAGSVAFKGENIEGLSAHKLVSKGISRTFQNIRLLSEMTVLENVQLGHHHKLKENFADALLITKRYKTDEEYSRTNAFECLEFVGLENFKDEKTKNLPYGMQRKLEIARALATGAEMLLFDEPCAGMNTSEKDSLADLIRDINSKLQKTVVLIEHDMRFVMNLSEYITVLSQGELLAVGTPQEIQENQEVISAYLGSARKERQIYAVN